MLTKFTDKYGDDKYINLDKVCAVELRIEDEAAWVDLGHSDRLRLSLTEGLRLIALINESKPAPAPLPAAPAPQIVNTTIISMTRDATKNSGSPFWRCGTGKGFMVNVFKHDDPLKDTFKLFDEAGYDGHMLLMELGETINWLDYPIHVGLIANGNFWNVVSVAPRPEIAAPDIDNDDSEAF